MHGKTGKKTDEFVRTVISCMSMLLEGGTKASMNATKREVGFLRLFLRTIELCDDKTFMKCANDHEWDLYYRCYVTQSTRPPEGELFPCGKGKRNNSN